MAQITLLCYTVFKEDNLMLNICRQVQLSNPVLSCEPHGNGHINSTTAFARRAVPSISCSGLAASLMNQLRQGVLRLRTYSPSRSLY